MGIENLTPGEWGLFLSGWARNLIILFHADGLSTLKVWFKFELSFAHANDQRTVSTA